MKRFDSLTVAIAILAFGLWYFYLRNGATGMIQQLANAIYSFEDPNRNALATKNNNPGNLKPPNGSGSFWPGQTGVDPHGFAVFDSFQDGWNALVHDLTVKAQNHPDWSLQSLFNVWLGGGPNTAPPAAEGNAINYATFVAGKLGTSVSTTLGQIFQGA